MINVTNTVPIYKFETDRLFTKSNTVYSNRDARMRFRKNGIRSFTPNRKNKSAMKAVQTGDVVTDEKCSWRKPPHIVNGNVFRTGEINICIV